MKRIIMYFMAILFVGGLLTSLMVSEQIHPFDEQIDLLVNAEVLADSESQNYCYHGGVGATSCSIEAGINIFGFGTSTKCQVSCTNGYYACCGLRCTCEKYPE